MPDDGHGPKHYENRLRETRTRRKVTGFMHDYSTLAIEGMLIAPKAVCKQQAVASTGTWESKTEMNGNSTNATLTLSSGNDGGIVGTIEGLSGSEDVLDAKLENEVFTFSTPGDSQGYSSVVNYRGKLRGEEIVGEVIFSAASAGVTREFAWKAKKVR